MVTRLAESGVSNDLPILALCGHDKSLLKQSIGVRHIRGGLAEGHGVSCENGGGPPVSHVY